MRHKSLGCMQIELAAVPGPQAKAVRLLRLTRIFATELLGSLMIIPYGTLTCNKLCTVPAYTAHNKTNRAVISRDMLVAFCTPAQTDMSELLT